jgi:hypothetical protein
MFNRISIYLCCALALSACEQQKQASAEVGAAPKTILDKAQTDVDAAEAQALEQAKALENIDAPAEQKP